MAAPNAGSGARSISGSTRRPWQSGRPSSPPAISAMRPCCPNFSTRSRPGRRSPPSPPTAPSTPAGATTPSPPAVPPQSCRPARPPDPGSPTPPGQSPATRSCAHRSAAADHLATMARVSPPKPRRDMTRIRKQSSGLFSDDRMRCAKLPGQRLSARDFDRQVAELQVRVAVLNGFTALGTPITDGRRRGLARKRRSPSISRFVQQSRSPNISSRTS